MATSDGSDLNDNTNDEDTGGDQDAVLSRGSLSDETRHDGSEPSSEFQNGSQPSLLCWVVNISVGFFSVSA